MSDRPAFDAGQTGRPSSVSAFSRSGQQANQTESRQASAIEPQAGVRTDVPGVVTAISAAATAASALDTADAARQPDGASKTTGAVEEPNPLKNAVIMLNDYVQSVQRDLEFSFDDESGHSIITVIDRNTKEVVRQLPDDLALELARNLQNNESMRLLDARI